MPKIGNPIPNWEIPCVRCGSKKRIAKAWTEKLKTNSGFMILEHKEIICTNSKCQADFEFLMKKEMDKRSKFYQDKQQRLKK